MNERPIIFSGPMVRAILDGRKTQTRRVVKLNASGRAQRKGRNWHLADPECVLACPYGVPGDRLWVRETWQDGNGGIYYATDGNTAAPWKPSIYMPRWASRITLEVVSVRVERLNEIGEEDAIAEGSQCAGVPASLTNRGAFAKLWDSINAKTHPWASNPWVWVVEFKRLEATDAS